MKPCLEWDAYPDGVHLALHAVSDDFGIKLKVLDNLPARFIVMGASGSASTVEEAKLAAEAALQKMLTEALEALMEARRKRNSEDERERLAATHLTPEQVAELKAGDVVGLYCDGRHVHDREVRGRTKGGLVRVDSTIPRYFDVNGFQVRPYDRWNLGPAMPAKEG